MAKWEKKLAAMRENPRDWSLDDLQSVSARIGIDCRKPGGSHVTFSHPAIEEIVTVPAARPVKPFYVRQLLKMIDQVEQQEANERPTPEKPAKKAI